MAATRLWSESLQSAAAGAVVGGYWPIRSEIDPRVLMLTLAMAGAELALPVITDPVLTFRRWASGDPLEAGPFGTSAPRSASPEVIPDILLVPLVAFDRTGARLGYGKAYYDRTIARMAEAGRRPRLVGVAFAAQEVERVPVEPHDVHLDLILTEEGVIEPAGAGAA